MEHFGLSNIFSKGESLKTACGSPCYAAPEMLSQSGGILHLKANENKGFYPVEDWMINREEAKKHGLEVVIAKEGDLWALCE